MGDKGVKLNFLRVRFVYICRRKARKCGGLDVEAVEATEKVQKEREREADWTLKWLGGRLKSKRSEKEADWTLTRWKPRRKSKRGEKKC